MLLYSGRIQKGTFIIKSTEAIPPGSKMKVTLILPDRQEVQMTGEVTTCPAEGDGFAVKLKLDPLGALDKERLDNVTSGKPGSRTPVGGVPILAQRSPPRTPTPPAAAKPTPTPPPSRPVSTPPAQPAAFVRPGATPRPATPPPGEPLLELFDEPPEPRRSAPPSAPTVRPGQAPASSLAGLFDTVTPTRQPTPQLPGDILLSGTLKRADDAAAAKDWPAAAAAFESALRLAPGDASIEARFGLMRAREALATGDEDGARIFISGALDRDPTCVPTDDPLRELLVEKPTPPPARPGGFLGRLLGRK
jgi:hypothetical protein